MVYGMEISRCGSASCALCYLRWCCWLLSPLCQELSIVVLNKLYLLDDVAVTFQKNNLHVFHLRAVAKVPEVESIQAVGSPIEGDGMV